MAVDSNDNVFVAGYASNMIDESNSYDWWIMKFSSGGVEDTTNWNKAFDGNRAGDIAYSLLIDSNNNIYIAGYGGNIVSASSTSDWWIKKFNP